MIFISVARLNKYKTVNEIINILFAKIFYLYNNKVNYFFFNKLMKIKMNEKRNKKLMYDFIRK